MAAAKFKTADEYVPAPKTKPRNKMHSKNYTPDVKAPKNVNKNKGS